MVPVALEQAGSISITWYLELFPARRVSGTRACVLTELSTLRHVGSHRSTALHAP